ncbi:DUF3418 domain-containing protein [Caldithrix abyssi]|uniref:RNA helicase HrpA C-terminal domain-containing protein n=2 Tax=Caldithrix abyssi DSM 13497 TaxID=880073 RepID=H1XPB7_CALAY|nr:DUF3418 domain-containing protein [Caldithrix abyssi]EHO42232.1 hypothetical protein Calab_2622 [Caldithrix abyssi DSM 13497]
MGGAKGLDQLMSRIEQLKKSLKTDDEVVTVVSDVLIFIEDLIPLMLEGNAFMRDTANKVPSAADNLTRINQTTEMATKEVLDRLERIMEQLESLKKDIIKEKDTLQNVKTVDDIQEEIHQIFYAFQFQDITSQQLEYVKRILKAINEKFMELFNSSIRLKGNTIFGKNIIEAIENETKKKLSDDVLTDTKDFVRQNEITQESIDKYFK